MITIPKKVIKTPALKQIFLFSLFTTGDFLRDEMVTDQQMEDFLLYVFTIGGYGYESTNNLDRKNQISQKR